MSGEYDRHPVDVINGIGRLPGVGCPGDDRDTRVGVPSNSYSAWLATHVGGGG